LDNNTLFIRHYGKQETYSLGFTLLIRPIFFIIPSSKGIALYTSIVEIEFKKELKH